MEMSPGASTHRTELLLTPREVSMSLKFLGVTMAAGWIRPENFALSRSWSRRVKTDFTGSPMVAVHFYIFRFCLTNPSPGDMIMKSQKL